MDKTSKMGVEGVMVKWFYGSQVMSIMSIKKNLEHFRSRSKQFMG